MKHTLVVLAILVSRWTCAVASAQSGQMPITGMQPVTNELLPFQSDGCTGWIDSFFGRDYTSCCLAHDVKYWLGGTRKEKLDADIALRRCVRQISGAPMSHLMFAFVWVWGKLDTTDVTRWANGWRYLREKYQPVTDDERRVASQLAPADLSSALRRNWSAERRNSTKVETYQAEPFPTVLGNYCLDEVAGKLARTVIAHGRPGLHLTYVPAHDFPNAYRIRTNLCKEEIWATFNVNHVRTCAEPVWGVEPSHYLLGMSSHGECGELLRALGSR